MRHVKVQKPHNQICWVGARSQSIVVILIQGYSAGQRTPYFIRDGIQESLSNCSRTQRGASLECTPSDGAMFNVVSLLYEEWMVSSVRSLSAKTSFPMEAAEGEKNTGQVVLAVGRLGDVCE